MTEDPIDLALHPILLGSNILAEIDEYLKAMAPRRPEVVWLYVDQRGILIRGLRGAYRREGKPAGQSCKEFNAWLQDAPRQAPWCFRGIPLDVQVGRLSPTASEEWRSDVARGLAA